MPFARCFNHYKDWLCERSSSRQQFPFYSSETSRFQSVCHKLHSLHVTNRLFSGRNTATVRFQNGCVVNFSWNAGKVSVADNNNNNKMAIYKVQ